MTRSALDEGGSSERKLSAERGESIRAQAGARAHALRGQMLRDFGGWIVDRPLALLRRFRAWRTRRQAARELQRLDNRTLRDMGISRSEIEYLVAGGDAERRAPRSAEVKHAPCAGPVGTRSRQVVPDRCAA